MSDFFGPGFIPFCHKDRVKAFDDISQQDGKLVLFTDNFFAKSEEDTKCLHNTILFNDLLDIQVIEVRSSSSTIRSIFNAIENELAEDNIPAITHKMAPSFLSFFSKTFSYAKPGK